MTHFHSNAGDFPGDSPKDGVPSSPIAFAGVSYSVKPKRPTKADMRERGRLEGVRNKCVRKLEARWASVRKAMMRTIETHLPGNPQSELERDHSVAAIKAHGELYDSELVPDTVLDLERHLAEAERQLYEFNRKFGLWWPGMDAASAALLERFKGRGVAKNRDPRLWKSPLGRHPAYSSPPRTMLIAQLQDDMASPAGLVTVSPPPPVTAGPERENGRWTWTVRVAAEWYTSAPRTRVPGAVISELAKALARPMVRYLWPRRGRGTRTVPLRLVAEGFGLDVTLTPDRIRKIAARLSVPRSKAMCRLLAADLRARDETSDLLFRRIMHGDAGVAALAAVDAKMEATGQPPTKFEQTKLILAIKKAHGLDVAMRELPPPAPGGDHETALAELVVEILLIEKVLVPCQYTVKLSQNGPGRPREHKCNRPCASMRLGNAKGGEAMCFKCWQSKKKGGSCDRQSKFRKNL